MSNHSFTHLDVWKKAHQLVLAIYKMSARFPADERYVLTSQIRSAAISIPANIAEGYGRRTPHDKARFYTISKGSAEELSYFLMPVMLKQAFRDSALGRSWHHSRTRRAVQPIRDSQFAIRA